MRQHDFACDLQHSGSAESLATRQQQVAALSAKIGREQRLTLPIAGATSIEQTSSAIKNSRAMMHSVSRGLVQRQ
jgi:hypothetical protein